MADLHIGKVLSEQSLLEDQKYMLNEIIEIALEEKVDAILICGDIYDKSIPSTEAVDLLDEFLNRVIKKHHIKVFIISGNHDSKSRLNFGSKIFEDEGLYIETNYRGTLRKIELEDADIYMLPFIKPIEVRKYFEDEEIKTYEEAIKCILQRVKLNKDKKNILMAHQFVTYKDRFPERCDSETVNVGSIDNVDAKLFFNFDYVALGHIHGPQRIGKDTIRYSGTMLKYSFSEVHHNKSLIIIDTSSEELEMKSIPLKPLRDMREIRGPLSELLNPTNYVGTALEDYIFATITDEEPGYSPLTRLRSVYPNILKLEIRNSKTAATMSEICKIEKIKEKSPSKLFEEFYEYQNAVPPSEKVAKIIEGLFEELDSDTLCREKTSKEKKASIKENHY